MAQFLCFCLILANALLVLPVASEKAQTMVQPNARPSANPPASPPSSNGEGFYRAEAPMSRRLGRHQPKAVNSYAAPGLSPSEAPQSKEKMPSMEEASSSIQTAPIEPGNEENGSGEGQGTLLRKQHHHSIDKSIAGGGVILGGLGTTFLVAVFCYIRATGRHKAETVA